MKTGTPKSSSCRGQANPSTRVSPQLFCGLLRSRYVACIYDLKVTILAATGEHLRIDMSSVPVTNQKGDGDALMAAIVDVFLSEGGRSANPAAVTQGCSTYRNEGSPRP